MKKPCGRVGTVDGSDLPTELNEFLSRLQYGSFPIVPEERRFYAIVGLEDHSHGLFSVSGRTPRDAFKRIGSRFPNNRYVTIYGSKQDYLSSKPPLRTYETG